MEISTQMTFDIFLKYFLYSQKKVKPIYNTIGIICIMLAIFYTISCIVEPSPLDDILFDIFSVAFLLVIGIIFLLLTNKILPNSAKKVYQSNKLIASNPVYTFQFNQNNYKILITSSIGIEEGTYSYEMINSVIETNDFIYITIGNNQAYIINKVQENLENQETIKKIITFLKDEKQINYIVDTKKK